jgi:hypothetical protein
MEQKQLKKLRAWFGGYVAGFYGDDKFINANLKLKEKHSYLTCDEILYLANELGLSGDRRRTAEVIALFHDIGRFEQIVKYRTFNDSRSVSHSRLGVQVLRREKILEDVEAGEREWIEKAVEYHGCIALPEGLDGEELLFSKLIRDADKIDIFRVSLEYYGQYRDERENFLLELDYPDEPGYSAEVIEQILGERRIDYGKLRTLNDVKLCQLGWVYDVNFPAALKRIKQCGFLEKIFDFLPADGDIKKVREKIFGYVGSRIDGDRW